MAVDIDTNQLLLNVDGTQRPIATDAVKIITVSETASLVQSGTTFVANHATAIAVTLPPTQAGLKYTLVVGTVTSSTGHSFHPDAADKIMGNGLSLADHANIYCTPATDRVGDSITLVGDGSDGWYITAVVGTWAAS
jgi:hypothetical protein